ncbi:hypothetical protein F5X96DRAFT_684692 [Biscogniauxia mediterranea]|nr:hypothetical protein F5X96DRAFT_684692 [Biscogniauxia mediterranea]
MANSAILSTAYKPDQIFGPKANSGTTHFDRAPIINDSPNHDVSAILSDDKHGEPSKDLEILPKNREPIQIKSKKSLLTEALANCHLDRHDSFVTKEGDSKPYDSSMCSMTRYITEKWPPRFELDTPGNKLPKKITKDLPQVHRNYNADFGIDITEEKYNDLIGRSGEEYYWLIETYSRQRYYESHRDEEHNTHFGKEQSSQQHNQFFDPSRVRQDPVFEEQDQQRQAAIGGTLPARQAPPTGGLQSPGVSVSRFVPDYISKIQESSGQRQELLPSLPGIKYVDWYAKTGVFNEYIAALDREE